MATVEHPLGLNSEQHRAFAEKVFWQTAGIVNLVPVQGTTAGKTFSFEEMGTGSACRWKNARIVLTAKHVLQGAGPSEVRFFLRPSGQIDWCARSSQTAFAERVSVRIDDIVRCAWEDLACLILAPDDADHTPLHFRDLPAGFGATPPSGAVTFLLGYPSGRSFPVASARQQSGAVHSVFAAEPDACWGSIVGEIPRFLSSKFDPDRHFLIRFDPSEEGSMPHGYSGTGVWYQNPEKRLVWAADPVLAGVQTGWFEKSKVMVAVRPEVVKEFLEVSL
jgi:hypothetical protein